MIKQLIRTIPKNSKMAHEVFRNAELCKVYTLDNQFIPELCPVHCAEEALNKYSFAKLRYRGPGRFDVVVHDNKWYVLKVNEQQMLNPPSLRNDGLVTPSTHGRRAN